MVSVIKKTKVIQKKRIASFHSIQKLLLMKIKGPPGKVAPGLIHPLDGPDQFYEQNLWSTVNGFIMQK